MSIKSKITKKYRKKQNKNSLKIKLPMANRTLLIVYLAAYKIPNSKVVSII